MSEKSLKYTEICFSCDSYSYRQSYYCTTNNLKFSQCLFSLSQTKLVGRNEYLNFPAKKSVDNPLIHFLEKIAGKFKNFLEFQKRNKNNNNDRYFFLLMLVLLLLIKNNYAHALSFKCFETKYFLY